jgi:hypothetical protein
MICQAKPSAAGPTVSWVGGERRLCGKGELAGSEGERFLAAGGSQLPVECSMLLPMLLEVRKNTYRSYFLTGSQNVYLPTSNGFFCWSQPKWSREGWPR